ncbi:MAG: UDP-N-acetylmuramate--L-alanine ligase [Oscillospiraceae bacterium]
MSILDGKRNLHFIGIGGSGMFPIVQILKDKGYTITGSDVLEGDIINYERDMGIKVTIPHDASCVVGADLVVYSAAIFKDNCEIAKAKELGIPCVERSIMLGEVSRFFNRSICVSGTHGKTTTTSLISQIMIMAGKDPACVIGGKLPLIQGYGRNGKGDNVVIEACEYSYTFLELSPSMAIVLNIAHDHLEFFKTFENLQNSFKKFCALSSRSILINGDDENTTQVIKDMQVPITTFGIETPCDYRGVDIRKEHQSFYSFDVEYKGNIISTVHLSIPGRHNIYNALASFAACHMSGVEVCDIEDGINAFGGAGRRFEILGTVNGITIADDYAHHPEEITATLKAAKDMGFKRVWAVFQPFTYTRTKMLLNEFAQSLKLADKVVMTEIMGSREVNTIGIYTSDLAKLVPDSVWFEGFRGVVDYCKENAQSGDLIITLGCGDVYKAAKMMVKEF